LRRATVDLGGARSALAVPLRNDETLLGIIVIYRQEVARSATSTSRWYRILPRRR